MNPTGTSKPERRRPRLLVLIVALLIMATAGIVVWNSVLGARLKRDQRYIPEVVEMTSEMELLAEYVRIDTSTPAGAAKGARWIAALLRKNGVEAELIASAPDRLNVYARIRGSARGEGLLLFNHIDVVPAGSGWTHPAFSGQVIGDELLGRGTIDMKGVALAQLLAFAEIARSGRPPAHDLVFLATADEETGSQFGMQWIIANRPDVLEGIRYGITEGGLTEMSANELLYFGVEIGGKQMVDVDLTADAPEKLRAARIALEPFMFKREPDRVLPEVNDYFESVAPSRLAYKERLADIDRTIAEGKFWDLAAPYRDLTQNSLFVAAPKRADDGWRMNVRMLNLPDELPDARLAWLATTVRPYGATVATVHTKEGPVPLSTTDTRLLSLIEEEAQSRYKVPAGTLVLYSSGTDARFLRPLGIVCYGVAPIKVTFYQTNSIHGPNERVHLRSYQEGIEFMKSLLRRWSKE